MCCMCGWSTHVVLVPQSWHNKKPLVHAPPIHRAFTRLTLARRLPPFTNNPVPRCTCGCNACHMKQHPSCCDPGGCPCDSSCAKGRCSLGACRCATQHVSHLGIYVNHLATGYTIPFKAIHPPSHTPQRPASLGQPLQASQPSTCAATGPRPCPAHLHTPAPRQSPTAAPT
jgi:hypothetical protein